MSERGGPRTSLGVYADGDVVGHVMWGLDDDEVVAELRADTLLPR
jgi:hypothetical protein